MSCTSVSPIQIYRTLHSKKYHAWMLAIQIVSYTYTNTYSTSMTVQYGDIDQMGQTFDLSCTGLPRALFGQIGARPEYI